MLDDTKTLDRIAQLLLVANQADSILSETGMDLLSEWVSDTGRKVR